MKGTVAAHSGSARIRWPGAEPVARLRLVLKEELGGRVTRTTASTGNARVRSGMSRRGSRMLASGAIVAVGIALLLIAPGGSAREYHVMMQNAGQLVPGDLVRIGGVQAGSVKGLELTPNGQADVTISLLKNWGRLHAGTTVTVRASGIATVTGLYVDISPGPS